MVFKYIPMLILNILLNKIVQLRFCVIFMLILGVWSILLHNWRGLPNEARSKVSLVFHSIVMKSCDVFVPVWSNHQSQRETPMKSLTLPHLKEQTFIAKSIIFSQSTYILGYQYITRWRFMNQFFCGNSQWSF